MNVEIEQRCNYYPLYFYDHYFRRVTFSAFPLEGVPRTENISVQPKASRTNRSIALHLTFKIQN